MAPSSIQTTANLARWTTTDNDDHVRRLAAESAARAFSGQTAVANDDASTIWSGEDDEQSEYVWLNRQRREETVQTPDVEIGEVRVQIITHVCCGVQYWMGRFPDGSICCLGHSSDLGLHETRKEAVMCCELRLARCGFQMELPPQRK